MKTRLVKAQCSACGYVARITRKWLNTAGPPLCPCNGETMECPDYEWDFADWAAEQMQTLEVETAATTLKDKWVTLRSIQHCAECNREMWHGDQAHHKVYTVNGEFSSEYTCLRCGEKRYRGRHAA